MGSSNPFKGCNEYVDGSDLCLVDFGRAVDLTSIDRDGVDVRDRKLIGEASEKSMRCVAMRKGRPWSFDIDTFGLCASAHILLFRKHMKIEQCRNTKRWKPCEPIKSRVFSHPKLWIELFDTLLNSDQIGSRPRGLNALREKFEICLAAQKEELSEALRAHARKLPANKKDITDPFK